MLVLFVVVIVDHEGLVLFLGEFFSHVRRALFLESTHESVVTKL